MKKGETRTPWQNLHTKYTQTWHFVSAFEPSTKGILLYLLGSLCCCVSHSGPRQYLISLKAIRKRRKYFPLPGLQTTEIASGFVNTWH